MKIIIYDSKSSVAYNPDDLLYKGVGGAEVCIVNLAKAFQKLGHRVIVYNNCNKSGEYDGVRYDNFNNFVNEYCDLFIGCESFPREYSSGNIFNWTERPQEEDAVRFIVDRIIAPSKYHKDFLKDERVQIIPNGIEDYFFNSGIKIPHKMIYAGFTGKGGMAILPKIYRQVSSKFYDTELIVCGDGGLWGQNDEKFIDIYIKLAKNGIIYMGNVSGLALAHLMATSSILINPVGKHHRETFGLVVGQAMATGCIPVTSGEGNLGDLAVNGKLIFGDINSQEWVNDASNTIINLFNSQSSNSYRNIQNHLIEDAKQYNWLESAKQFIGLCK